MSHLSMKLLGIVGKRGQTRLQRHEVLLQLFFSYFFRSVSFVCCRYSWFNYYKLRSQILNIKFDGKQPKLLHICHCIRLTIIVHACSVIILSHFQFQVGQIAKRIIIINTHVRHGECFFHTNLMLARH